MAACDSGTAVQNAAEPAVPNLDLPAVESLRIGAHDAIGTTADGLYLVADGALSGADPLTGKTK